MITTLYRAGIDPQTITSITKHKNTTSLAHYIDDISDNQKKECCNILTKALSSEVIDVSPQPPVAAAAESPVPGPSHALMPAIQVR